MELFKKSEKLASDIESTENKIAELQQKLKELNERKKKEENLEIISMVRNSGLSLTDVAEIITSYSEKVSAETAEKLPLTDSDKPKGALSGNDK